MKKQQSISKWTTKISQQQTQVESAVPQERNSNKGSVCESRKQEVAIEHAEVVKPSLPQVEGKLSVTDVLKQNQPKNIKFPVQTFGKSKRSFNNNNNNKKRSHTQLDSRKQVIAFQDRVITINIKEAQHPLK